MLQNTEKKKYELDASHDAVFEIGDNRHRDSCVASGARDLRSKPRSRSRC